MTPERAATSLAGKNPLLILLLMVLTGLLWGASFPIIKLIGDAFPPATLASLRGIVGATALLTWFVLLGQDVLPRSRREVWDWIVLGAINGWVPNLLVNYAIQALPAGQASMIQASGPLMTAILAHQLFADERLNTRRLLGIMIGFFGVALLVWPRISGSTATPVAALAMLAVAFSYSIANIYIRTLRAADPRRLALGQQLCSAIFATSIAVSTVGVGSFAAISEQFPLVIVLGLVTTAIPVVLFMYVIRAAGPTRAAVISYLVPTWAVILSALFIGEALSFREVAAGAIILAGVYIVSMAKGRS